MISWAKNLVGGMVAALFLFVFSFSFAQERPDLEKLKDPDYINQQIKQLDEEIKKYEKQLNQVQTQKQSLSSAIKSLDISARKTETQIKKTKNTINLLEKSIQELEQEIKQKQENLKKLKANLSNLLRKLYINSDKSYIEILLGNQNLTEFWSEYAAYSSIQDSLVMKSTQLQKAQAELEQALEEKLQTQNKLTKKQRQLLLQKQSLQIRKQEKQKLLKQTQNKEEIYQRILQEKKKAMEEFKKALAQIESKLAYKKTGILPKIGEKVLIWPLKSFRITQYFGNTPFARSGAYKGNGHNGIDLGVPLGTPVLAAADGVVLATGNTDAYPGCLSYGKWILLKHDNGLATMYAHLSRIIKSPGERVVQGEAIAFSGSSGYSTGPHLHFGVYDASAVRVVRLGDVKYSVRCANARIPIAPWKAYFNPLDFLPKL